MIIVTGGAGFIGSAVLWKLNQKGIDDILVVDNLGTSDKWKNLVNRRYLDYVHKIEFITRLEKGEFPAAKTIVHMGACSSTTERDADFLMENNFHYTLRLAQYSLLKGIRFINASSAATYGDGTAGFSDDIERLNALKPVNMYGYSKHLFDLWTIRTKALEHLVSLKFFNVFGPNEYHKQDMCSMVYKGFRQIQSTGRLRLFKSYQSAYPDGGQRRDFIYVKDCVDVIAWLMEHPAVHGIFNLGTGIDRSWNDLATSLFHAVGVPIQIEYIDMPELLRDRYQYFTKAGMDRLAAAGCPCAFTSLENAVQDYVVNYLQTEDPYL